MKSRNANQKIKKKKKKDQLDWNAAIFTCKTF